MGDELDAPSVALGADPFDCRNPAFQTIYLYAHIHGETPGRFFAICLKGRRDYAISLGSDCKPAFEPLLAIGLVPHARPL
jgi:hypothetical protein